MPLCTPPSKSTSTGRPVLRAVAAPGAAVAAARATAASSPPARRVASAALRASAHARNPPSASRTEGSTSTVAGAVSICLPPWFDTQTASNPRSTARSASSGRTTPFSATGPVSPHSCTSHSASSQLKLGSKASRMNATCVRRSVGKTDS